MIYINPFAIIDCINRDNREFILKTLFSSIINNNKSIIIFRTRIGLFNFFRWNKIKLYSNILKCVVYSVNVKEEIQDAIQCLNSIGLWHLPYFHILIGDKNMPIVIREYLVKMNGNYIKIEKNIEEKIYCYIEPLDDELYVYGTNDKIINLISTLFPESIQEIH
jgi:hypothetical protein